MSPPPLSRGYFFQAQLARLEALLGVDSISTEEEETESADSLSENFQPSSPAASFHSSDPRSNSTLNQTIPTSTSAPLAERSNSLLFTNLPEPFFTEPSLASALLDLLNAYGPLVSWNPLMSLERATVVYEKWEDAKTAKDRLDRLLLPFEEEGEGEKVGGDETPRRGKKGEVEEG